MIILLDIDGVMVTTPSWKKPEIHADGFMAFNDICSKNLATLIEATNAEIVLTTTHRFHFTSLEWLEIFKKRGIIVTKISKVNNETSLNDLKPRNVEIQEWVANHISNEKYLIIDDDLSLNNLPNEIKQKWVQTKPLIGFDAQSLKNAFKILRIPLERF